MVRVALGLVFSLVATAAMADPCKAIPGKGPKPKWAKPGYVVAGPVRYVGDGDSLCVGPTRNPKTWVEIRLADFYAPELREPGGGRAKATLERITTGRTLTCTAVRGDNGRVVSYDRLIAVCRMGDRQLAEAIRREGVAEGGRGLRGR